MIDIIFNALGMLLLAVVAYIIVPNVKAAGAAFTKQIAEKTKSERLSNATAQATDIVVRVVAATEQTFVDNLKKAGEFGAEEQLRAFEMAREAAADLISAEIKELINEHYNSFDNWLLTAIEAAVARSKGGARE